MRLFRSAGAALAAAVVGLSVTAGDLDPPGAPASTMTDLQSIAEDAAAARSNAASAANEARGGQDPRTAISEENTPGDETAFFIISEPGSYYLTDNIVDCSAIPAKNGIFVNASDVTIDLNGFTLDGSEPALLPLGHPPRPQGPALPATGILASETVENISVHNGTVRDWSQDGIHLAFYGGSRVQEVSAHGNGRYGIVVSRGSVVSRCVAQNNGDRGFSISPNSVVTECTAEDNGAEGFSLATNTTVENCSAYSNDSSGFRVGSRSQVRGCVAEENGDSGFQTSTTDVRSLFADCVADRNGFEGFSLGQACVIRSCIATNNGFGGISVRDGSTVQDCSASYHPGFAGQAGAEGINAAGDDCRIDGNNVWANDVGIEVLNGSRCVVIRNRASQNETNYAISGIDNAVGPFIGGNPITSTNPWANFSL